MHIFRAHCCPPSAPQPGESWGASSSGENLCPRPAAGGNPLLRPLPQAVPGPASGSVLISPESPPCGHNLFKRSGHGTSASTFQPDLGVPTPHPPHAHPHGAETPTSDPGTRGRCPTPKRPPHLTVEGLVQTFPGKAVSLSQSTVIRRAGSHTRVDNRRPCLPGPERWASRGESTSQR